MVTSPLTFESEGLRLSYRSIGSGPSLVLIHGWGANGREWEEAGWPEALVGRTLLIPDVRGHGASAKPHDPEMYFMEALARDVLTLVDAVGEVSADIFGYSMGGTIALWCAVLAPSRVRSLVAGAVTGAYPGEAVALGRSLRGLGPPTPLTERYREFAMRADEADFQALGACLDTGLPSPECAELAVFGGEALLAAGNLDRRREVTERLAGCLPGGRFILLDDADHMAAFEDDRFKNAVVEFLDEVSPR